MASVLPGPQETIGDNDLLTSGARAPQVLIREADEKAAEFQLAKVAANMGCPPCDWNARHPCEFGVFQKGRDGYAVAPLFPATIAELRRDGFRCVYRTDGTVRT